MVANLDVALKRGFLALKDGDFEQAYDFFEQALNFDPENVNVYIGELLAELRLTDETELSNLKEPFSHLDTFKKILSFGDEDTVTRFQDYNNEIIYKNAKSKMQLASMPDEYIAASKIFNNISSYKDSAELKVNCENEAIFVEAIKLQETDAIDSLKSAIGKYDSIADYRDSSTRIDVCQKRIDELLDIERKSKQEEERIKKEQDIRKKRRNKIIKMVVAIGTPSIAIIVAITLIVANIFMPDYKYNKALRLNEQGAYDKAVAIFGELGEYKDSVNQCKTSYYNLANDYLESNQIYLAATSFYMAKGYKDAEQKSLELWRNVQLPQTISISSDGCFAITDSGDILKYGNASIANIETPQIKNARIVYGDRYRILILDSNGTVRVCGSTIEQSLGMAYQEDFIKENYSSWYNLIDISGSIYDTIGLKKDGTVLLNGLKGEINGLKDNQEINALKWSNLVSVKSTGSNIIGVTNDGKVLLNRTGIFDSETVSAWDGIVRVTCGSRNHIVGLKADGTCVATGSNDNGQCNVEQWKNVKNITSNNMCTVALLNDGTVVTTDKNSAVNKWTDIVNVFASEGSCQTIMGLKADGSILVEGEGPRDWKNIKTK